MNINRILTAHGIVASGDSTPPNPITFSEPTKTNDPSITLTWTNPYDGDFAGVRIVRKANSQPTTPNDGTVVFNGVGTTVTDTDIEKDITYYYRAYAYDYAHNMNETIETQVVSMLVPSFLCYGFRVDESKSNPYEAVTYIEESASFTPASNVSNSFNGGSWLDKFPFNAINPIAKSMSDNPEINVNQDDFNKDNDGNTIDQDVYDIMIKIPPIYWKFTRISDTIYEVRISDGQYDEGFKALAHSRGDVLKGDLYVGTYTGYRQSYNSVYKLRSRFGVAPAVNMTLSSFREYATNIGEGYGLMTFHTWTLIQILFVLMFKSLSSQTSLGFGIATTSAIFNNGKARTNGMYYGSLSDGSIAVKFIGLENIWGNTNEFIDGYFFGGGQIKISDNTTFSNAGTDYPIITNSVNSNYNMYISQVYGTQETAFCNLYRESVTASGATYYCDSSIRNSTHLCVGGKYNDSAYAGIFCQSSMGNGSSSASVSARLQYLAP